MRPDITTLGKALGGGLPISAVCGRAKLMDLLAPGGPVYQASTFAGNPVSVAASLAAVRAMSRSRGLYSRLERACGRLAASVGDAAADLGIPHTVNRVASMFQIFFTGGPVTDAASARRSDAGRFGRMFRALLGRGVFVAPSQSEAAFLSAAHGEAELAHAEAAYRHALGRAR